MDFALQFALLVLLQVILLEQQLVLKENIEVHVKVLGLAFVLHDLVPEIQIGRVRVLPEAQLLLAHVLLEIGDDRRNLELAK